MALIRLSLPYPFNSQWYITGFLRHLSVRAQDISEIYPNWSIEIVVVVNGDRVAQASTLEAVKAFQQIANAQQTNGRPARVTLLYQPLQGMAPAMNAAAQYAKMTRAEIFFEVDDDLKFEYGTFPVIINRLMASNTPALFGAQIRMLPSKSAWQRIVHTALKNVRKDLPGGGCLCLYTEYWPHVPDWLSAVDGYLNFYFLDPKNPGKSNVVIPQAIMDYALPPSLVNTYQKMYRITLY